MKKYIVTLLCGIIMLCVACMVEATPVQWTGNGHWYDISSEEANSWGDADAQASNLTYEGLTGHLATISSLEENQFIVDKLDFVGDAFLGGFQTADSSTPDVNWQWLTGEEWAYKNWNSNEPNDGGDNVENNGENYLSIYDGSGKWNDVPGTFSAHYITEFESAPVPEPATMLLFVMGITVLAGIQRKRKK